MTVETLRLRPATMEDAKLLFDWRDDPDTRFWSHNAAPLVWEDHLTWLERWLGAPDRVIFVGEAIRTDDPIGVVRFDEQPDGTHEVGITVAPRFRGRGWAGKLLRAGLQHREGQTVIAQVMSENRRSRSLFASCGFRQVGEAGGVVRYRLDAPSEAAA